MAAKDGTAVKPLNKTAHKNFFIFTSYTAGV